MNHKDYAKDILAILPERPATLAPLAMDDGKRGNAGRCMAAMVRHRLAQNGAQAQHVRHSLVEWNGGVIGLRNSRHAQRFWTNINTSVADQLRSLAERQATVYLFVYWQVEDGIFHAWAVPEDIAFDAIRRVPRTKVHDLWSIEISPEDHQVKNAPGAPSFAPFYARADLTEAERAKLLEAIKTDDSIKQERQAAAGEDESGDETTDDEPLPGFTNETVAFLLELPEHVNDGPWHEENKQRYERVLRDPSQAVVDQLRTRYIQRISPVVAGGKRHLSILNKNDFGKGGYHDHYWFAFYDPAAGSKTKSVQLYVRFLGAERIWGYGFSMGNYCEQYMDRLMLAMVGSSKSVADYVSHAPQGTVVRMIADEVSAAFSPEEFANQLATAPGTTFGMEGPLTNVQIVREFPLGTLPDHAETLVDEIGEYFTWCWPFFDAATTGAWKSGPILPPKPNDDEVGDVDERAPQTIPELAELTALSEEFLEQLEDALLAKQQAILVGPPGTSKTYIARQFARYFVRQRLGRPQGSFDVLYMHANWAYEDFFEGLKPTSRDGTLTFEPRLGFFLKWVEGLKAYSPKAVHVLVLDEINRCDTAAVLGELLQLLEYRGTTVQLLSGRSFVFPSNVFIIGTMNSADRSIGRLDLAMRRRFLWLDLHPKPDTLNRWLQRAGNNPLGFKADSLVRCNELLAEHGIPAEQQIGHALFMLQRTPEDDEASPKLDTPLNEKHLRQVVQFSVLPYVRELLTMQFGQADAGLLRQISDHLLDCVNGRAAGSEQERTDDQPPT